jgi:hypothetical protein
MQDMRTFAYLTMALFCLPLACGAYEIKTHRLLSEEAFARSVLADLSQGPLVALGVEDLTHADYITRPPSGTPQFATPSELVGAGAEYEDQPLTALRVLRHFFDPQQGGIGLLGWNTASPLWILEDEREDGEQQFSVRDAQTFYLDALTQPLATDRRASFVLLLESIGRAVHHLQDMTQPAHVRDDAHLPIDYDIYEAFTERWFIEQQHPLPTPFIYGQQGLNLRDFNTARKFWSHNGKGIAEYTSNNFLSRDTGFLVTPQGGFVPDARHPLPAPPSDPQIIYVPLGEAGITDINGSFYSETVGFLSLDVEDKVLSSVETNPRAAAVSAFSAALSSRQKPALVTQNNLTFRSGHELLLPRAIAYSTGLINYFFRGRLALDSIRISDTEVELTVRNLSAGDFALAEGPASGNEFTLWFEGDDSQRHPVAATNVDLAGQVMPFNGTRTFSFQKPQNVAANVARPYLLVFSGVIGTETGTTALSFGPVAGAFLVIPNFSPTDGYSGPRLIAHEADEWNVKESSGVIAGNIDWRGKSLADTLTWDGPPSRYFYTGGPLSYSRSIYRNGKVLAQAPAGVQGAAINRTGDPVLYVVTNTVGEVHVYRRPLRDVYNNNGMYDATTNPDGWRDVYAGSLGTPFGPTFFNASGTEAQFITTTGTRLVNRVRLSFSGAVSASSVPAAGHGVMRQIDPYGDSPTGARQLNVGERRDDSPPPGACSYSSECTQNMQCGSTTQCALTQLDHQGSDSHGEYQSITYEFDRPSALCVDYKGDTEVLCELTYPNDGRASFTETRDNWSWRDKSQESFVCGPEAGHVSSEERMHRESTQHWFDGLAMRVLKIGGLRIPVRGRSRESIGSYTLDRTRIGNTNLPFSGSMTDTNTDRSVQARVLYLDARNDTAVYETTETVGTVTLSSTTPVDTDDGWVNLNRQRQGNIHKALIVRIAGAEYSLRSQDTATTSSVAGSIPVRWNYAKHECSDVEDTDNEPAPRNTQFLDAEDLQTLIHPRANDSSQAYAFDRRGGFVVSQPIWEGDGATPSRIGMWNRYSEGNLGELIPGAEDSGSTFNAIRVVQ